MTHTDQSPYALMQRELESQSGLCDLRDGLILVVALAVLGVVSLWKLVRRSQATRDLGQFVLCLVVLFVVCGWMIVFAGF